MATGDRSKALQKIARIQSAALKILALPEAEAVFAVEAGVAFTAWNDSGYNGKAYFAGLLDSEGRTLASLQPEVEKRAEHKGNRLDEEDYQAMADKVKAARSLAAGLKSHPTFTELMNVLKSTIPSGLNKGRVGAFDAPMGANRYSNEQAEYAIITTRDYVDVELVELYGNWGVRERFSKGLKHMWSRARWDKVYETPDNLARYLGLDVALLQTGVALPPETEIFGQDAEIEDLVQDRKKVREDVATRSTDTPSERMRKIVEALDAVAKKES